MDYSDLRQEIERISGQDPALRSNWYSSAAHAYNATRPPYPRKLVMEAMERARLSQASRILEIGSGPGTATISFAESGCQMLCIEPNPVFSELARQRCQSFPSVQVITTTFEEWDLQPESFDAVLAASSMHWIPAEIGYAKASRALKENGHLILLWNKELQPCEPTPLPVPFQDRTTQENILNGLGQMMLDSGRFSDMVTATVETHVTYSWDQYRSLLGTYSTCQKLDTDTRNTLFTKLRQCILEKGSDEISLSYLSTYHIAKKSGA